MEIVDGKLKAKVSIIIPCRKVTNLTERCIKHCEKLANDKEIIVVTDKECPGYPALKRNWAMERATGEVYAFIDDDAYPSMEWLDNALYYLKFYPAVCGPGVLPFDAPLYEIAADMVLQSMPYAYRVRPTAPNIISEFPSFNLIVRKERATPFENFLTGEDTIFCRRIPEGIFYHPSILVYHNRRPLFRPMWKQVGTFGRHRGHLIRLAVLGLISVNITYIWNFFKSFLTGRKPS